MKARWLILAGAVALVSYAAGRARASGIPSTRALAYAGTLLNNGVPESGLHSISLHLWASGESQPACTTGPTTQKVSSTGRFTVTLGDSCVEAVHQNPELSVEVIVDGRSLGRAPITAVPYAIETAGSSPSTPSTSAFTHVQVFDSDGSFVVPSGVSTLLIEAWGDGGGGGSGLSGTRASGRAGGGGGGYGKVFASVTAGTSYTVTVGGGGQGQAAGMAANGGDGAPSAFGTFLMASGGAGGVYVNNQQDTIGGAGGSAQGTNSVPVNGGQGARGFGDMGGTGGSASNGGSGGVPRFGMDGIAPGGGGSGSGGYTTGTPNAGSGAHGRVVVYW